MATDISGLYNSTGGYYAIASAADLQTLASYVNGDDTEGSAHDCKGLTFKLTANIDLKDVTNFAPIGTGNQKSFNGTFDGGNYTISNLTINLPNTNNNQGLFGYVNDEATIQNVKLSNVNVSG